MKSSRVKYLLIAVAFFIVGLVIPSPLKETRSRGTAEQTHEEMSRFSGHREETGSRQVTSASPTDRLTFERPETLQLQTEVIEALIKSKELGRMLPQMGLDEEQVKGVLEIKAATLQRMKDLEVKHAKLESDEEGGHYAIEVFPEDHDLWMAETAQQLQDLIGDDRAGVISRIIAKSYNNESTGLYRRKVRMLNPKSPGGDFKIRESFFNEDGELFDHDYKIYQGINEDRWEHFFKPEGK